ncbi:MAG TPA: hypothetical protein VIF15_08090 [Polyangiaceae bacterium]|jgi:hypothetical protein
MLFDVSRARWSGVGSAIVGVVLAGATAATGCSSTSASTTQPDASVVCPATPDDSIGKACAQEGLRCGPAYPCGFLTVPLLCICTGGSFQCTDGAGNQLNPGDTPQCPGVPKNPPACPATELLAIQASCSSSQIGQTCAYPPQCPGGTLAYDVCSCMSGATKTGNGLGFECDNTCGGGSGFDAGVDAGADGAGDGAPEGSANDGSSDGAPD